MPDMEDVRSFTFDAATDGVLVIDRFDVDETGRESSYDTLTVTFDGRTVELRDGESLLAYMLELETDGAHHSDTDTLVTPDRDIVLRFDDQTAVVLDGAAGEFAEEQLNDARVDYELFA